MARTKTNTQNDTKKQVQHHDATDINILLFVHDHLCDKLSHICGITSYLRYRRCLSLHY